MKKLITVILVCSCLGAIATLFWYQEVQYLLPTELPSDFEEVEVGSTIDVDFLGENEASLLHFYNPNCPCSKFNYSNFESIQRAYQYDINSYLIVQGSLNGLNTKFRSSLREMKVKVITDHDKEIAKKCGVYSTPQIALVDQNHNLYYKGNYNQSRYCTNPQTNYAKIAIERLLIDTITMHIKII